MNTDEYLIRQLSVRDQAQLVNLFRQCYPQAHTTERAVRWKFFSYLLEKHPAIQMGAFTQDGSLVSQYSNLPLPLTFGKKQIRGLLCADMATAPGHRGKGLISRLSKLVYQQVVAQKYTVSIGFSNAQGVVVDKQASDYGYTILGPLPTYYKLVLPWQSKDTNLLLTPNFKQQQLSYSSPKSLYSLEKSTAYLNWRYTALPEKKYQVYVGSSAGQEYAVVVRQQRGTLEVLDVLLTTFSIDTLRVLLRQVTALAAQKHAYRVVFSAFVPLAYRELLRSEHFVSFQRKTTAYYVTVKPHTLATVTEKKHLLDRENWWLVGGDLL